MAVAPTSEWSAAPPPIQDRMTYPWADILAELKTHPMEWTPMILDAPVSLRVAINNRRMKGIRDDKGYVEAIVRDSYIPTGKRPGARRGNIHMRYVPNDPNEQARILAALAKQTKKGN